MKKILVWIYLFVFLSPNYAYELGYGVKVNDYMHINGYVSTEYLASNNHNKFVWDDIALLGNGYFTPQLSYTVELESILVYIKDFSHKTEDVNPQSHIERLYLDYAYSDMYNFRLGKQITPIGYWNYQPINVLRDTTSNPLYSYTMFPKLFTGIDLYGQLSWNEHIHYHIFFQNNPNINDTEVNIKTNNIYGVSFEYAVNSNYAFGGSVGHFRVKNTKQSTEYAQINMKYTQTDYTIKSECIYTVSNTGTKNQNQLVGYVQGTYNLTEQHALVGRYEYINQMTKQDIGIFGYSYRPVPPVSYKIEYQLHKNKVFNHVLMSFSVLF